MFHKIYNVIYFAEYQVGSLETQSKMFYFKTFPVYEKPNDWAPKFAIFGDLSNNDGKIFKRLQQEAQNGLFDAIFHTGDMGLVGNIDAK